MTLKRIYIYSDIRPILFLLMACCVCSTVSAKDFSTEPLKDGLSIRTANYGIDIHFKGFRYALLNETGDVIAPAHDTSGLFYHSGVVSETTLGRIDDESIHFHVTNTAGIGAEVVVVPISDTVRFTVQVKDTESADKRIVLRTAGVSPSFGLGDHSGWRDSTDLTGYSSDRVWATSPHRSMRLISNFVIFPQQLFAEVNVEPRTKIVRLTNEENAQGLTEASELPAMYYFFGEPKQIYAAFHKVRNTNGYKVYKPKYEWFGVGWEAYGALAWNTNQQTVTENVEQYLEQGYPLSWMVVGSGFWPNDDPNDRATTSFGLWDTKLYHDPKGLIQHFHERGLKFMLGLRISFICDGPYSSEGVKSGYFIKEDGQAKVFDIAFPKRPVYLLDTKNHDAVRWYMDLCDKWTEFGVDGFKEDLFGYDKYEMPDDKIDPVNYELMERGIYLMGRNGYLTPPGDIQRYDDFNYNQNQDRGPINGLGLAYSGMFNVYPDIVGGTGLATQKYADVPVETLKTYFARYAEYAALHPSMSFGYGPWNFNDSKLNRICLDAARLHASLQPYIYSSAIDAWKTGFPHTMCPLPLLWPERPEVYELENSTRRGYQWMLGDSLLATPLYGNDCTTAQTRDVYIPPGKWMDYTTGEIYEGPRVLEDFPLPLGKVPLFVGGKSIIVVRDESDGPINARVYPVALKDTLWSFNWPDGESTSSIQINSKLTRESEVEILDTTENSHVEYTIMDRTRAITFELKKNHKYRIDSKN